MVDLIPGLVQVMDSLTTGNCPDRRIAKPRSGRQAWATGVEAQRIDLPLCDSEYRSPGVCIEDQYAFSTACGEPATISAEGKGRVRSANSDRQLCDESTG